MQPLSAAQVAQKICVRFWCSPLYILPNRQLRLTDIDYNACIAIIFRVFYTMATMTIRNLDDELKTRLRLRAARHGQSMEEEARSILRNALRTEPPTGRLLLEDIRSLVEPLDGVELELPPRKVMRDPPDFG